MARTPQVYLEHESNLNKFRQDLNMTWRELSNLTGVSYGIMINLSIGITSPFDNHGRIKPFIKDICSALNAEFQDIWPRYFCRLDDGVVTEQIGYGINHLLDEEMSVEDTCYKNEALMVLYKIMEEFLTPDERDIIISHIIYDKTLDEIAKIKGMSKSRPWQKLQTGLRKLRRAIRFGPHFDLVFEEVVEEKIQTCSECEFFAHHYEKARELPGAYLHTTVCHAIRNGISILNQFPTMSTTIKPPTEVHPRCPFEPRKILEITKEYVGW